MGYALGLGPHMVDDITIQCIEACLDVSTSAGEAASHCLRWGGDHAHTESVNALVTCSAVTRMIADRLGGDLQVEESLLALGIDVCRAAGRVCADLDDPDLRPCALTACACVEAIRAVQAAG